MHERATRDRAPAVIDDRAQSVRPHRRPYERLVAADPNKRLVDPQSLEPSLRLDVRYATPNNFMHTPLYLVARVFVRQPVAEALRDVQHELATKNLGLKLFDGYRPYRVTERMWEPIRNPDFVADPAKGSRHNRGAAVDLTIVDLATGNELAMPTPYDDFTSRARQDFNDLPADVVANRALLRDVMTRHGFEPLPSEWWHFDFGGWDRYELMDLDLAELASRAPR
jgi:D-alanyl-D-alanine dipeptidase